MIDLMGHMITEKNSEARAKHDAEIALRRVKAKTDRKLREERGIMLKAKLLKVRDGIEAASV